MVLRWAARSCRSICGALVHIGGGLVRRTLPPVRFLLRNAWQALTALTGFYWYHRDALWQSFLDRLESSESSPQRQFEIRLTADREYKTARALDSAWEVELSDGCVYCGAPADGAITDERAVSDLTWPFWSIQATLISGLSHTLFNCFLWALHLAHALGRIENLLIEPERRARVVVDQRSGTIVMGADVRISRVAVSQGNLTLKIEEAPPVVQPNPFAQGDTVVVPRSSAAIEEEPGIGMAEISDASSLSEVVAGLNALGVSPRDMIDILKSINVAGALHAEFVVR